MSPLRILVLAGCFAIPTLCTVLWVSSAGGRLEKWVQLDKQQTDVAVAKASDVEYCSPELKRILRRVLQSCGLMRKGGTRGCHPLEAKNVATVGGDDFNALFQPMKERGGIVQYEVGAAELDIQDRTLIDEVFSKQKGASYFFVVARASPEGSVSYNRKLSKARAEAVLQHLTKTFRDPDLEREVGLLWLGEEFAQLDKEFCSWRRSGESGTCDVKDINRGAFIAWIDCQL